LRRGSLGFATPFFPDTWDWIGLYMLEMGREDGSSSLQDYWETLPTIPWAFEYTERGNGKGLAMCSMARVTGRILVSQQTWMSLVDPNAADTGEWNGCTNAFNKYLAPFLEFQIEGAPTIVVFSSFREDAYIVSPDKNSWDDYSPARAILGPLPDGWGIVGV